MSPMEMAYRKTAVGGASGFGLLIALYDTLAGDLRRAADADRANDIQMRCKQINHALLVIGHLEDSIERGCGGELAKQLAAFYSSMRRKMILAMANRAPEILEEEMAEVLKLRAIWQAYELRGTSPIPEMPVWAHNSSFSGGSSVQHERTASSWSA